MALLSYRKRIRRKGNTMELKENQGILFKNDRKTDKHPAYKGSINVEGKIFSIALWNQTSSKGTTYLSVKVETPRDVKRDEAQEEEKQAYDNLDDEIPFD